MRMITESTGPISRLQFLLELTYWLPLMALLLSLVGLIALKRMSERPSVWGERLLAPPVYVVALSIATLVAGMEVLGWYALISHANGWLSQHYGWLAGIGILGLLALVKFPEHPVEVLLYGASFVAFWAAQFVSGRLLWQTLWQGGGHEAPSNRPKQHLRALFLLLVFAWTFVNIRSFVLFRSNDVHLKLRIVRATSSNSLSISRCRVESRLTIDPPPLRDASSKIPPHLRLTADWPTHPDAKT